MSAERPRAALNAQLARIDESYRSAGIARYLINLLRELGKVAPDFDLSVYSTQPQIHTLLPRVEVRSTRMPVHKPVVRILWEQTVFATELYRQNYALLHSLAYVSPLLTRTPSIVTIYDLSFLLYPQFLRPLQRLYLNLGTRVSARRARRILTISESSKRDIVKHLKVNPTQIDVVYPGVASSFLLDITPAQVERFRRERNLPEHFILFIGTREPRKNLPTLLRAFAELKLTAHLPHSLVLAGGRGWGDQEIDMTLRELDLENHALLAGYVADEELPLWYRAADCFVYPSQYEGFGLPALEALACGTPVITSNVSSLPEAVGDAAVLVNPTAPGEITDALVRILTNETLRAELRERGFRHSRQFTWNRAAQSTAQAYRRVLGMSYPVPILSPTA